MLIKEIELKLTHAENLHDLDMVKSYFVGRNGIITKLMDDLRTMSSEERKEKAKNINEIKVKFFELYNLRKEFILNIEIEKQNQLEELDLTLPPRDSCISFNNLGTIHPMRYLVMKARMILSNMGFEFVSGPDLESEYNNFEALNMGANHPARQMQDSFYLDTLYNDAIMLRTHTSTTQIRAMKNAKLPIKFASTGRVYRNDYDATHTPTFHQIELMMVDQNINICHMKYVIQRFINELFGTKLEIRLRPSYFPFTQPSVEVDIMLNGKWLEIMGAGMIHPKVLQNCNIDSSKYTGFAFGAGVERLTMILDHITDLRSMFGGDLRFNKAYGYSN